MYRILLAFLVFFFAACIPQRKLQRSLVGKPFAEIKKELGQPTTVFDNEDGKLYVFEKEEELESTEIHQARLTLDPIVTPKVLKTERYYITVKGEVVTKVRIENEYERQ